MSARTARGEGAAADEARRYCFDLVRDTDKDRFLSALFAPDERRADLLALYAFNIEIARIREQVSEPTLGEIRLEWWRSALEKLFAGTPDDHPVLQALARPARTGLLSRQGLENLVEARRFDLYDDPMPTLNDLEGYLGETSSSLIQMGAWILDGKEAAAAAGAAGLAGVAYGIAGLLRALPVHRARGQCYLPSDMLAAHGLTPAHVLSGRWSGELETVLGELHDVARKRLDEARVHAQAVPHAALPAFLPVALVDLYLAKLRKTAGPDMLKTVHDVSQFRRQWRLWRCAWREYF